jgi:hypothetical protein
MGIKGTLKNPLLLSIGSLSNAAFIFLFKKSFDVSFLFIFRLSLKDTAENIDFLILVSES